MVEIEFIYNSRNIIIQGKLEANFETIMDKFINKAQIEKNSVYCLYQGKILDYSNNDSKLVDIIVSNDKASNKIKILVHDKNDARNKDNSLVPSKNIICPECKGFSQIKIKDYKINIFDCKNGHNINGILLKDFQNTQKIDISQIICHNCEGKNKSIINNNEFYRCINCKINLCLICKSIHDNCHYIINYEKQYFICNIHKEFYTQYCEECKLNICSLCSNEHKKHKIIAYKDIIPNISDVKNQLNNIREKIDESNKIIEETIIKLKKIIENNEIYYNIFKDMVKNYDNNNINYKLLQNLKNLKNNNFMNNLNEDKLLDIYYKMNKTLQIKKYEDGEYKGELKNNKREGKGIMIYKNGNKYEGDWKNDVKEGKGIMIYNNGNKYEGEYKDNVRKKGIYIFTSGSRYIGEFNDKRNGKGVFYHNNGDKYEGNFVEDKRDGYGVMHYNNGDVYEGNWVVDKKKGKGFYYYKDGRRYEGNFENDKKNGEGIIYHVDGTKEVGEFSEGKILDEKSIIIDKYWNIIKDND